MPDVDYELLAACRRVVEGALGMVPGERLVLIVDSSREDIALVFAEAARWREVTLKTFVLEELGRRPLGALPGDLREALGDADASIYVASALRDELDLRKQIIVTVAEKKLRHAHLVEVTAKILKVGLAVDPKRINDIARALKARLRPDSTVHLRSKDGSDLEVRCDPRFRWIDNSLSIRPGHWENVPSGELLTAPAHVAGTFVANASVTNISDGLTGALATNPLHLDIQDGFVRSVECSSHAAAEALKSFMRSGSNQDRVGLFSFGTNVGLATATGHVLADQTLPGLHLVLGMTHPELTGADWNAREQFVLTAGGADLDLDGVPIMRGGRYLI